MMNKPRVLPRVLKILGCLLVLAAGIFTVYNLRQANAAAENSRHVLEVMEQELKPGVFSSAPAVTAPPAPPSAPPEEAGDTELAQPGEEPLPDYVLFPEMEMPHVDIEGHAYIGVLSIPSLELDLPVMSDWDYDRLKLAPCRYSGSAYKNDLVIAAHNYARHFGQLSSLSYGDEISFTDVDGNVFRYAVLEMETLQPYAIDYMKDYNPGLSLFTCTIGGEKRLTVRAVPLE